jgi:predicted RNase H-like nuclease (RuvC/YqgF family)
MSSIGLSGMSGISENTLQTRYEKALKQINKLIEMNRQLKEAQTESEQVAADLRTEIERVQQANRELDEENNILESKYMELDQHYHDLQEYCADLEAKYEESQFSHQHYEEKLQENEAKYHEELESEMMKSNELAREVEMLNQMYQ